MEIGYGETEVVRVIAGCQLTGVSGLNLGDLETPYRWSIKEGTSDVNYFLLTGFQTKIWERLVHLRNFTAFTLFLLSPPALSPHCGLLSLPKKEQTLVSTFSRYALIADESRFEADLCTCWDERLFLDFVG